MTKLQLSPTPLRTFVAALTDDDRHAIIESYIALEHDGHTGDTPVRTFTQAFIEKYQPGTVFSVINMAMMAHACYEFFYHAKRD